MVAVDRSSADVWRDRGTRPSRTRSVDLPHEGKGNESGFTGCVDGKLKSWIAPTVGGFYGYWPGYREGFWILDVEDTRLVIRAERSAGPPPEHVAEMRAIPDSIEME
jgi:hypothetical protein